MASNIFGPTEEPQNIPKRTNPPGMAFVSHQSFGLCPLSAVLLITFFYFFMSAFSNVFWCRLSFAVRVLECKDGFVLFIFLFAFYMYF